MRVAIIGVVLLVLGGIAVATGALPTGAALQLGDRVWPVLLFAVAVTIVAELAAAAGVFSAVATRLSVLAGVHTLVLWLAVVLLAVVSTALLSLDTTAVLLTPVVVLLATEIGLRPHVFALTTVWLANTASLWLPVSNLTNLLAMQRLPVDGTGGFVALMWAPALAATLTPLVVLFVVFRRDLRTPATRARPRAPEDRLLFWIAATVTTALLPALALSSRPWIPASCAAIALIAVFAVRRPRELSLQLVPIPLIVFVCGLFLVVDTVHSLGAADWLGGLIGHDDLPGLARMAFTSAFAANVVDNLPAYLMLEPFAHSPTQHAALLIGVNAGPLITPWASLATLLWHDRLRTLDVDINWRRYIALGLITAPVTVATATLALWVAHL